MCNPAILTARYLDVLQNQLGLSAKASEDTNGTIALIHDGYTCFLNNYAPADPEYLEITLGLGFEGEDFSSPFLDATARRLTRRMKSVTVLHTDQGLLFTLSSIVAPPRTIPTAGMLIAVIPRLLSALSEALEELREELKFHEITSDLDQEIANGGSAPTK